MMRLTSLLKESLRRRQQVVVEKMRLKLCSQLVIGVSVLHERAGLSHNDLHDNMLLLLLVTSGTSSSTASKGAAPKKYLLK